VDAARPNFLSDETVFEDIYEIGFLILDVWGCFGMNCWVEYLDQERRIRILKCNHLKINNMAPEGGLKETEILG
jgi:hypothetical protein